MNFLVQQTFHFCTTWTWKLGSCLIFEFPGYRFCSIQQLCVYKRKTEKTEKELNYKSKWTDDIFEKNKFVENLVYPHFLQKEMTIASSSMLTKCLQTTRNYPVFCMVVQAYGIQMDWKRAKLQTVQIKMAKKQT